MKVRLFISTLILWIVNIVVYYLFNYPEHYSLLDIITQHVEWKWLLLIYIVLIVIAIFASLVFYKKISFSRKLIRSIVFINVLCTILMLSNGLYIFYSNKQELNSSIRFYQNEARTDIKKDKVKELVGGLILPPRDKNEYINYRKKDSIRKKYGIVISGNCIISESMEILKNEYKKISEPYLEKRNGKNWRAKMKKEIDAIK